MLGLKSLVVLALSAFAAAASPRAGEAAANGTAPANATTAAAPRDCKTIAELVVATPELSTLLSVVSDLELVNRFNSTKRRNVTVFAPTNDAFVSVNTTGLTQLDIFEILSYHVLPGVFTSDELFNGKLLEPYVLGSDITVGVTNATATEPAVVKVNNATVTKADIVACNGVVHLIDEVLIPTFVFEKATTA